jgi:hypothetical protein
MSMPLDVQQVNTEWINGTTEWTPETMLEDLSSLKRRNGTHRKANLHADGQHDQAGISSNLLV